MTLFHSDKESVVSFTEKYAQLREETAKVIVGQDEVVKNRSRRGSKKYIYYHIQPRARFVDWSSGIGKNVDDNHHC